MVYYTCKQEILYILYWEVIKMLLRDSSGRSVEFHLFTSSGVDLMPVLSLVMLTALILLTTLTTLSTMPMMLSMGAILI